MPPAWDVVENKKEEKYQKKKQRNRIPSNIIYHNNIFMNRAKFIGLHVNDNETKIMKLLSNYKIE